MNKAYTGAYGEFVTGKYLRENDFDIFDANYRCRMGEIDIIASDGKYICFIEVKTRDKDSLLKASDAVDYNKRKRIIATSQFYLAKNPTKLQPRFDVCEVYLDGYEVKSLNYIKNAYQED
jgi:putative endonuclease